MKVPMGWLGQYCDSGLPARELAERLSMTGTEVERVTRFGAPTPEGFVLGHVIAVERHPNADRLSVCTVADGQGERTIVCGAPNVAAGQVVAVALPGTVLADGSELDRASLRGVESEGMILSERELALGDDHRGIAVLGTVGESDGPLAPGRSLGELASISDEVLELEVTPNRPDCLSIYGVAREVHAVTGAPLAAPPWAEDQAPGAGTVDEVASVDVEDPDLCPRFTARAFEGVRSGPAPLWMRARLAAAGQRPISSVVDVTNYVMLETGQPLHAFDLDLVPGGEVRVRRAGDGERLRTLDGIERTLDSSMMVVADHERATGLAGIMGGEVSEVSDSTTRVLLEAATWDGTNILETSGRLALRSEASTRFEKQLHPELALRAQRAASRLMAEIAGATVREGTIDVAVEPPATHVISLSGARLAGLLGIEIDAGTQRSYLEALGYEVDDSGEDGALAVTVPADRHFDTSREVDLIEEVARIHDLDRNLPSTLPPTPERVGGLSEPQRLRRRAEDVIRDRGLDEIVAWSFVSPELAGRLGLADDHPLADGVRVLNPLSADQSVMRTTLLGGLLDAARLNRSRGVGRVALYESGRVYERAPALDTEAPLSGGFRGAVAPPVLERHVLAALVVGSLDPEGWRTGGREADFFDLKGVAEGVAGALGVELETLPFEAGAPAFLHPGRSARVLVGERDAGWVGELNPLTARRWDLPGGAAFEIGLGPLVEATEGVVETYEELSAYPAIYQDIACVVPGELSARELVASVREAGGDLLADAHVFDVYSGEQVEEGRVSIALRLEFRAFDRTLTDAEADEARAGIERAIEGLGGMLRG